MPHSEVQLNLSTNNNNMENTNMSNKPAVNGEKMPKQTLDHLKSYPLTNDIINIYSENQLGRASINISQAVYFNLVAPFLPMLRTPYSYVSPYVQQADHIGDDTLNFIDDRFPAVKDTGISDLKNHAIDAASLPFNLASSTRDYVSDVWADEYAKTSRENNGRKDMSTFFWAMLSTDLRIAAETMRAVSNYLAPKRDQAAQHYNKMKSQAKGAVGEAKEFGAEKTQQGKSNASTYLQYGQDQVDKAVGATAQSAEQGKDYARGTAKFGEQKLDQASQKAAQFAQQGHDQGMQYADAAKQNVSNEKDAQYSF